MVKATETGHANNVSNLESLIISAMALDKGYNPSKESLKISALQTLLSISKESLSAVNAAESVYSNAVDIRELAFEPFGKLITRVNNSLKASDSTIQTDESAKTIFRKLQGKRAGVKLTEEEMKALQEEGKEVSQISVSQMGYDSRLENFNKLISFLSSVPQYTPNEEDLKVDALKALHSSLKIKNTNVMVAYIQLANARTNRNELLYKPLSGLVDLASDCKMYIKSVYGASSPQFKQVSKLTFVSRN